MMKGLTLLGLVIISLLAVNAQTAEIKFTRILERGVSQFEAVSICEDRGMRLPTARELALYGMSRGAEGIIEFSDNKRSLIYGMDKDGYEDKFYYNERGYWRPFFVLRLGDPTFLWSSSFHPEDSFRPYVFYYSSGHIDNDFHSARRSFKYGVVRCVEE